MATRSPWDPWGEMRRLQRDLETLFDRSMGGRRGAAAEEFPPVNVTRGDAGGLVVDVLCPGVDRATLDVTLVGDALTIRGERRAEAVPDNRYHRRERQVGPFARTVRLGDRFDSDRVAASYRDGILKITLSRAPEAQTRRITIEG
jgi:HSP20 family protein